MCENNQVKLYFSDTQQFLLHPPSPTFETLQEILPAPESSFEMSTLATDMYDLGLIFWQIAQKQPFEKKSIRAINTLSSMRPEIPNDTPAPFKQLIENCWCHDPKERWTAQQAVEHIQEHMPEQ